MCTWTYLTLLGEHLCKEKKNLVPWLFTIERFHCTSVIWENIFFAYIMQIITQNGSQRQNIWIFFQKRASSSSCEIYTQRLLHGTGSVLFVMVEGFNK